MRRSFERFASVVARSAGHPTAFIVAFCAIVTWAVVGPLFGYSDTWQLVVNTGTTVLTFLMVFVIQNSLNRDSMAVHLKLDELLRATLDARDSLIGSEELSESQIAALEGRERELAGEGTGTGDAPRG